MCEEGLEVSSDWTISYN